MVLSVVILIVIEFSLLKEKCPNLDITCSNDVCVPFSKEVFRCQVLVLYLEKSKMEQSILLSLKYSPDER